MEEIRLCPNHYWNLSSMTIGEALYITKYKLCGCYKPLYKKDGCKTCKLSFECKEQFQIHCNDCIMKRKEKFKQ